MLQRRIIFLVASSAAAGAVTALAAGCFQTVDPSVSAGASSPSTVELPDMLCATGSADCHVFCGSPSCAAADAAIPTNLATPLVYVPDGSMSSDPCDDIVAEALTIRIQSCTPCHDGTPPAPTAGFGNFNYILDAAALATSYSGTATLPDGSARPMLVPGRPQDSYVYQRMVTGLANNGQGMPPDPTTCTRLLNAEAGAAIVRPSTADVSILYAWILNCVPGTDGGAYGQAEYGVGHGWAPKDAGALDGAEASAGDAGSVDGASDAHAD